MRFTWNCRFTVVDVSRTNWPPAVSGSTGNDASDSCAPWVSRRSIRNPGPRFGNRHMLYTLISSLIILRIILTAGSGDYATQSGMGCGHHLWSYGTGVCLFSGDHGLVYSQGIVMASSDGMRLTTAESGPNNGVHFTWWRESEGFSDHHG